MNDILQCPVCHEPQLNRDLLRVHLIQEHGKTAEEVENIADLFGGILDEIRELSRKERHRS